MFIFDMASMMVASQTLKEGSLMVEKPRYKKLQIREPSALYNDISWYYYISIYEKNFSPEAVV